MQWPITRDMLQAKIFLQAQKRNIQLSPEEMAQAVDAAIYHLEGEVSEIVHYQVESVITARNAPNHPQFDVSVMWQSNRLLHINAEDEEMAQEYAFDLNDRIPGIPPGGEYVQHSFEVTEIKRSDIQP